jgi:riboflavin biosynthesis pyrimidine reductase
MEIIWRTAMSMDGRIASHDESLAFLDIIADQDATVSDFPAFLASVDAILVGAGTLRWLVKGGHGWPHAEKPTWVVTHDAALVAGVATTSATVLRFEGALPPLLRTMEEGGARRVWLAGGGELAGQLLALDRIDEVDVTIAPAALGAGPSLFGARPLPLRVFELVECRAVAGNAVGIRWRRTRVPPPG